MADYITRMPETHLESQDRAMLEGEGGEALRTAMRVVVEMARMQGATRLRDITAAHIDGCLYHGRAGLDFAERLVAGGGRVAVPTTLNVASLDLLHPHLYRGDRKTAAAARRLMAAYQELGCRPTWTCAPYQLDRRPAFGEHVAWAESNAIAFANSVLGARTERYGDFIDICAALTGRVPDAGLHREENRLATILITLKDVPRSWLEGDTLYPVLGHLVGRRAGYEVTAIEGLPADVSEDRLKVLGAAAASSGAVALFHVVGRTPEAATRDQALAGGQPRGVIEVGPEDLRRARAELSTAAGAPITAVSLGTPHLSLAEFEDLTRLVASTPGATKIETYASTGRDVLAEATRRGWTEVVESKGVKIVTDTCTYITPIIRSHRVVMTNSAKWAYYAPGNLGMDVVFAPTEVCVRTAFGLSEGNRDGW